MQIIGPENQSFRREQRLALAVNFLPHRDVELDDLAAENLYEKIVAKTSKGEYFK